MSSACFQFCRILRLSGAILALCAAFGLLSASGVVPFLFAVLAEISGEHQVVSGADNDHLRVILTHSKSPASHRHGLISRIIVSFAETQSHGEEDHTLCFRKLRYTAADSTRLLMEKPRQTLISSAVEIRSWCQAVSAPAFERVSPPRVSCTLAVRVARSTIYRI